MHLQNILVVVDPTATEHPSIQKAELLAKTFDARVELFICDTKAAREMRLLAQRAVDPSRLLDVNLKPKLEALAEPLRARGIDVSTDCEFADLLADGLVDRALRANADLVIKDTHHHSLLQRTLISNTDWHLIRACPVPLLLTKSKAWTSAPRIIAAVDPGHLNDKPATLDHQILQFGKSLSQRLGGSLHAVHVYIPLTIAATAANVVAPMANTLTPEALEYEDKHKREEVHALTGLYDVPEGNVHLDLGVPTDMLPRKAEELGADVVVMGAIARSGMQRLFIGSTAERVLEKLPCDALVVKAPDFRDVVAGM
jgi:universal stress protein E